MLNASCRGDSRLMRKTWTAPLPLAIERSAKVQGLGTNWWLLELYGCTVRDVVSGSPCVVIKCSRVCGSLLVLAWNVEAGKSRGW